MCARAPLWRIRDDKGMLLVFGYGSLIWKPPEGFQHTRACVGGIKGFARRMWQGSTDHRGLTGSPGLVATLVRTSDLPEAEQDANELCWGMVYGYSAELRDEVLAYLDYREKDGYDRCFVDVFLQSQERQDAPREPDLCGVLLYVAQTGEPHKWECLGGGEIERGTRAEQAPRSTCAESSRSTASHIL